MIRALFHHNDQWRSVEVELTGGVSVALGIRYVYFSVDGKVAAAPVVWTD